MPRRRELTDAEREQAHSRLAVDLAVFRTQMAGVTEAEVLAAVREAEPVDDRSKTSTQAAPAVRPRASASTPTRSRPA